MNVQQLLESLNPHREPAHEAAILAGIKRAGLMAPAKLRAGRLGTMTWVVTFDEDGDIHVSLKSHPMRPRKAQIEAFFKVLGCPVPPNRIEMPRGFHWTGKVVNDGH